MTETRSYNAHVGGRWEGSGTLLDVHDPSDWDTVVARVPALGADVVREGYKTAREGARIWGRTNALERGRVLFRAAAILRDRASELARLLAQENGKTLAEATGEVGKSAEFFEFYAGVARLPYGDLIHDARPDTTTSVWHEPVGVVLAITPWNDPLLTPSRKLAPAFAAGNAVVLKPASDTPTIALELTRALVDAGLPPEAITTVTGRIGEIGEDLVGSPEIDAITFTGSTGVGLDLQRKVAGRNIRVQCEMGGKNAAIVLADADLDLAAETIAAAGFAQAGQRCTATSRVLVEASVKDSFVERLVAVANSYAAGPSLDPSTVVGPMVSRRQQSDVIGHVATASAEGATIAAGGTVGAGEVLQKGCYVLPTVLDDVTADMTIWRTEVFGPVVAVLAVSSLDEAVELANASEYGLSAALFTKSMSAANTFLRDIDAGQAAVNLPTSGWDVHHPFGGFKLSGSPFKEQGLGALAFYTRTKTCAVRAL
ncbi:MULTISPECIES: aldehyde dehydrogenase [unclassified Pseudofrankia]|uniref:aldehyde dehydrogenase family protein n=1 Tax=unclassified Pseudofrankia TaxID=2994372 RepID=UPI0008DA6156|nr:MULTISPECIES: aldehyde dehydrogenase family protein [unclassified Pseudofrankia]MDT3444692.1 aldehyde dehydrogenase family protein [Pseudofrankia sp. BMG5.37]OHV66570.1 aldehyde dehydrogenase [Pseudofrankia sp. BMG5.36]